MGLASRPPPEEGDKRRGKGSGESHASVSPKDCPAFPTQCSARAAGLSHYFTMSPTTARTLLALFIPFFALNQGVSASRPQRPRNVKMLAVERGLMITWDPPSELDVIPVERYVIGYGKSMRALRFVRVDKDQRSQVLEDVEPGVLHFLKMTAENDDGQSKPVYRAETPGGRALVKLDGLAAMRSVPFNRSVTERRVPSTPVKVKARPIHDSLSVHSRAPHPSSLRQTSPVRSYLLGLAQNDRSRMEYSPRQADRRGQESRNLASESVYVVSLQAQKALGRSSPVNRAALTKIKPSELEEMYDAKDITVRVVSPQSVLVTWVDPALEKEKTDGSSRHYTVRYREKGESARWDYTETTQRRLVIDTLSADNMYEFSVRISAGERDSKWSVSVFQRTPESAPSGPPDNFLVTPLRGKGTAVTATWDPPEESNGRIREYIVSYAPALKPFGAKAVTYRGSSTSAIIDGLQPGERYIFKIRATNRRGQGPQSKAFSVAMPLTSTGAATSAHRSRGHDSRRTSHSLSRYPRPGLYKDTRDSDLQSVEEPEEPTTTTHPTTTASPVTRRSRPLSQTRSYHSILSSVRSTPRHGAGSDASQRRAGGSHSPQAKGKDKEPEYEEEEEEVVEEVDEGRKQLSTQNNNVVLSKSGDDTSPNWRDPNSAGNLKPPLSPQNCPLGHFPNRRQADGSRPS
ncbi:hypothetical protein AAFF_G00216980 [Aldrovandia affinis]|uniref:Fibronectin type-III domain-containing protein n=1 Tax=Aldrovandia affinis TaxID=143900 RepID=A0AAD7SVM9_9TELE|nr:hypothetical protein AAFF_G00216980 [Aldrovandia affinis]